jgi:Skp family chaperone for outer membrane proteins
MAASAGAFWLARGAGAQDAAAASPRIAVVDVVELLNASPRKRVIEAMRRDKKKEIEDYRQEQTNHLKDLAGKLEATAKANPERKALELEFARGTSMLEFELKWRAMQAEQAYGDALEGLYGEVRGHVKEVALAGGYTLVLTKTDDPMSIERAGDFILSVAVRPVLHYDKAIDITGQVKAKMEAAKPPTPPATPPAPAPAAPGAGMG